MATKRIKPNRYKPESAVHETENAARFGKRLVKPLAWIFGLAVLSLCAIFTHDVVVQCPLFTVKTIDISGLHQMSREEFLAQAGLNREVNIFQLHLPTVEKKLIRLPWVARVHAARKLFSTLTFVVEEEQPLAVVKIYNLADVIINRNGLPFKEYDPATDKLSGLPVISGMDLSLSGNTCEFKGDLFNSVMDLLHVRGIGQIKAIRGDEKTGLTVEALDTYNKTLAEGSQSLLPIKLGFDRFEEKLTKARLISQYMEARFPSKTILAMDLYDVEKIFIKTKDAPHNTIEKGA